MAPIQLGYRLWPSNEEINVIFWENIILIKLDPPLAECLDPPRDVALSLMSGSATVQTYK